MYDNYTNCPICDNLHDDGAFILTESGHTYFICFDCDEKYPGDRARKILEEKERSLEDEMDTQERITAICLANYHCEDLENAFKTIEELFNACPGCKRQDLELLAEAYASLKIILNKIEDEPGFEKLYKLY